MSTREPVAGGRAEIEAELARALAQIRAEVEEAGLAAMADRLEVEADLALSEALEAQNRATRIQPEYNPGQGC